MNQKIVSVLLMFATMLTMLVALPVCASAEGKSIEIFDTSEKNDNDTYSFSFDGEKIVCNQYED